MIHPDLTDIFEQYPEWDYVVRNKYLRYVAGILAQHQCVTCRGIKYRHIEDLKVDLDADCYQPENGMDDLDESTNNLMERKLLTSLSWIKLASSNELLIGCSQD